MGAGDGGRVAGTLGIIALPGLVGSAGVILVNLTMPPASVAGRVEASFWIFAVIGALAIRRRPPSDREHPGLRWADPAVTLLAVLAVRLMVRGILVAP